MAKIVGITWGDMAVNPKPPGTIRLVCQSDTHTKEFKLVHPVPDGDIYLHAGDFTSTGTLEQIRSFESFLSKLPHKHKVVIAGNHDVTFDEEYYNSRGGERFHPKRQFDTKQCRSVLIDSPHVIYLQDNGVQLEGINIYGSPWQPEFCDWAFNITLRTPELQAKWKAIPEGVDVLMTHGPPWSDLGGMCTHGFDAGCPDLLDRVKELKPAVHLFGHIHEAYGVKHAFGTAFVNASTCTFVYRPDNAPVVIDLFVDPDKVVKSDAFPVGKPNREPLPGLSCQTV